MTDEERDREAEKYEYAAHLRRLAAKDNAKFDKMLREATMFNLEEELEQIGCGGYSGELSKRGLNEKGAFTQVTDAELSGPGLYIPKRARRRIMALAEMYRMQDQLAENERNQTVEKMLADKQENKDKYTLDGEVYFNTMTEMNKEWAEAETFQIDLKKRSEQARERMARGFGNAGDASAVGALEQVNFSEDIPVNNPAEGRMARKFKELQEKQSEDIDGKGGWWVKKKATCIRPHTPPRNCARNHISQDPAQMLNKYLSLRSKGRLAQLERTVPVREKRDHSVPVERMMSEIQEATRTDDWGLPVRCVNPSPLHPHTT